MWQRAGVAAGIGTEVAELDIEAPELGIEALELGTEVGNWSAAAA